MFESLSNLPVTRRWRHQVHPMPSVVALIPRESRSNTGDPVIQYLLIKRLTKPYADQWALIGGGWEFGETLATAMTREVQEETGLVTQFVALRGLVNERLAPGGPEDEGGHFVLFVCELAAPTDEAQEQSAGPVAWFNLDELQVLSTTQQVVPSDYAIIQYFSQTTVAWSYIEAEVMASNGEHMSAQLSRFQPGS